nr:MAG TPA: hypothetical protein [Crassvirales sp.]
MLVELLSTTMLRMDGFQEVKSRMVLRSYLG